MRQCCLDILHGNELKEVEVRDFWAALRTVSSIASEILPEDPPSIAPHLALQQEFEFAHMIYQMSRSVFRLKKGKPEIKKIVGTKCNSKQCLFICV